MKMAMKLSLFSNLVLVGCLIYVIAQRKRPISQHAEPAAGVSDAPAVQVAASVSSAPMV